jgi:hypothetical protein
MLPPRSGASTLDQMPPSPGSVGSNTGMSPTPPPSGPPDPAASGGPVGLDAMAGSTPLQIGSGQLPQEVLQGVMQVGQKVSEQLDALAQVTPDLGPDWQAVKQLLLATLAKLLTNGAPPASPDGAGSAFPGVTGGMERGRPF